MLIDEIRLHRHTEGLYHHLGTVHAHGFARTTLSVSADADILLHLWYILSCQKAYFVATGEERFILVFITDCLFHGHYRSSYDNEGGGKFMVMEYH